MLVTLLGVLALAATIVAAGAIVLLHAKPAPAVLAEPAPRWSFDLDAVREAGDRAELAVRAAQLARIGRGRHRAAVYLAVVA